MEYIKMFHVLFVFVWGGTLMTLTRFMGYHVKEEAEVQQRLAPLMRRVYYFVSLPTMILAITLGLILIAGVNFSYKPGWFHVKLLFVFGLIACDLICSRYINGLCEGPDFSKGKKYKILHGISALMIIGVLFSVYVLRDSHGEFLDSRAKGEARQEALVKNSASNQG